MTVSWSGLQRQALEEKLRFVYGEEQAGAILADLERLLARYQPTLGPRTRSWVDQRDVMLITYGDSVRESGVAPLATLHRFLRDHFDDLVSAVHILPFYPWSSDDGFSVIDYLAVDPQLGDWPEVEALSRDFEVMFDGVVNHISAESAWFRDYLAGDAARQDWFIEADPEGDYRSVTRPRALPLLTPFETAHGTRHLWTTFSADQIDLNFRNPQVLLAIVEVLLFYCARGARFIRLDAIGYLWKERGTSCIHLPRTHTLVKLCRDVVDLLAPGTLLITETNVPHRDNISYFGDGDEAHLVYQFPLPPLTLDAFHRGDARHLSRWAACLENLGEGMTFFNFLSSHDGIGVMPAKGILSDDEIAALVERVRAHGGQVSLKTNPDGSQSPYELNCNYLDALSHPDDPLELRVARFVAAQAILLSLAGVPGIYIHSLLGSTNWQAGVEHTGRYRTINREKLDLVRLEAELDEPGHLRQRVLSELGRLIRLRRSEAAFHPDWPQRVLELDQRVFALERQPPDGSARLLVLVNVSDQALSLDLGQAGRGGEDLLTGTVCGETVELQAYQVMWLKV